MDLIESRIQDYAERHTSSESGVLEALNKLTHAKVHTPQMLSGHLQGRFLSMLSRMVRPRYILEIGTYTGYSAICLAEGLANDGMLHTIDIDGNLKDMARTHFVKSGHGSKIKQHIGEAVNVIPKLPSGIELVFIDADKRNYSNYFDLVFPKMILGGWIIADNVLWSGKVVKGDKDKQTEALDAYNQKIQLDSRVENILVPIRDGLSIAQKIG